MTDKKDEIISSLEARIAALEAKEKPPQSTFVPMSDAEWIDRIYQMREGRMSHATPPSVVRDFAVLDDRLVKEIAP